MEKLSKMIFLVAIGVFFTEFTVAGKQVKKGVLKLFDVAEDLADL